MIAVGKRADLLPLNLPPRGLSRTEAAAYIGVSPTLFDEMVRDGRMPRPKQVNARTVWDRKRVDIAFDALEEQIAGPGGGDAVPNILFAV
jgi:predicted DNA-binding transcriptional regulator AlpA